MLGVRNSIGFVFCAFLICVTIGYVNPVSAAGGGYDMRAMMSQPYPLAIQPPATMFTVPGNTTVPRTAKPKTTGEQPPPAPKIDPYVPVTQWRQGTAPRRSPALNRTYTSTSGTDAPLTNVMMTDSGTSSGFSDYMGWGNGGTWQIGFLNEDRGPLDGVWGRSESGHLTWGWRVSYTPDAPNPPWFQDLRRKLGFPGARWRAQASYGLEQAAYTKHSINANGGYIDRPYAGVLLANTQINLSKSFYGPLQLNDRIELGLGMVGDASGAEVFHDNIHDNIGRKSRDWVGKLDSEPVFLLGYQKGLRSVVGPDKWLQMEFYPYAGGQVGNLFTTGSVGASLQLGRELKRDAGAPRIKYLMDGETYPETGDYWMRSVFASAEQKAVAWNIFTDGNTYTDTSDVTTKPFVHEFTAGAELGYGAYRLTLVHVYRTEEFEEQNGEDRFVRLGLSAHF